MTVVGLFGFDRRNSRKRYWLGSLGLLALMMFILIAFAPKMSSAGSDRGGKVLRGLPLTLIPSSRALCYAAL